MREDTPAEQPDDARPPSADDHLSPATEPAISDSSDWLTIDSRDRIETLLRGCGVCRDDEQITKISRAGEGNMNLTLRVRANEQTVIVKQSRPWVEKYPQIAAPVERILQELRFYETVSAQAEIAGRMPKLLGSCPDQYVMVLQCLGKANDAAALYQQANAGTTLARMLPDLIDWLSQLHHCEVPEERAEEFANRELRALNHQHIFVIPFAAEPALDLDAITPGLAEIAKPLASHRSLLEKLADLGTRYLADGKHLVHGDFFPGSWLICEGEVRIIDPEFSHGGLPEFDLGVLLAHGNFLAADGSIDFLAQVRSLYQADAYDVDWNLVADFAAVEVLRRLLGVAQLPLTLDLDQKQRLIDEAVAQLTK